MVRCRVGPYETSVEKARRDYVAFCTKHEVDPIKPILQDFNYCFTRGKPHGVQKLLPWLYTTRDVRDAVEAFLGGKTVLH